MNKNQVQRTKSGIVSALLVTFLLFSHPAMALDASEMFDDPVKEERAREIGRKLRCMVCQNQSIFDSNSNLARDLRVLVRERMEAGDKDKEVLSYISDRYGDYVLLEPRMDVKNAILWLTPMLALLFGGAVAFQYLRKKQTKTAPAGLDEASRAKAQALLKEQDQ